MKWNDQWVLKVGAQLTPMPGLNVRVGYNYGKTPLDPTRAFENMVFPAIAEHHLTAGVGYDVGKNVAVNVTGMYALNAKLHGSNAEEQFISSYSTEMSQLEVALGATYRF
jgi:long-chain fatty acid transport protein